MGAKNKDFGAVSQKDLFLVWKNVIFSISEHYRHAMSFHMENNLSLSPVKNRSVGNLSLDVLGTTDANRSIFAA